MFLSNPSKRGSVSSLPAPYCAKFPLHIVGRYVKKVNPLALISTQNASAGLAGREEERERRWGHPHCPVGTLPLHPAFRALPSFPVDFLAWTYY